MNIKIGSASMLLDILHMDNLFIKVVTPLWKDDLNSGFIARYSILLFGESRIFKDQHASNRNPHAAQRRLSESFPFNSIHENFGPRPGIDLDIHVKHDRRSGCFIAIDLVRHLSAQTSMAVFQRLQSWR